ncbi:mercury(II) reductase [Micromonospora haikouensis]|uniref:mercury(II) reductase n=1 Tax=Micromonospora haikouensis TaxID=686309 RepID=UPI0037A89FC3
MSHDLAIIGSGSGAFAAAIAARRRNLDVVMVEAGTVGGACVNTGCVPSKALLAAAEARHVALDSRFPGIATHAGLVDWPALLAAKNHLVEDMRADKYVDLAAEYGWQILPGTARFTGDAANPTLTIESADGSTTTVEAAHYVIATGSAPSAPPIDGLAEAGYLTSTTAMDLDRLPNSMIVIGGNAIGLEQGQLLARLGVRITVVEALDRLAPFDEPEVSAAIERVFADEGIDVLTAARVTAVTRDHAGYQVTVTTADGGSEQLAAERLLVATGRRPVTAGLGLDQVGVHVGDRGQVTVDAHLRTTNPRVWAAGDVTGHPQFVYVAGAHGALIVDNAFDHAGRTMDYTHLPRVTFTTPAIASVGLTDAQAAQQGLDCECRTLSLDYVPRAIVNRDTRGLVKIVAERGSGRIRGVHIIADGAGDAIAAGVYAVQSGMTVAQMADTWCPYLTMAEGLKLAAQTFTRDVAKLSCCAS